MSNYSTGCAQEMRNAGIPTSRTCPTCGFGPCTVQAAIAPPQPVAEFEAYMRGKSAGFSDGVAHGWDACAEEFRKLLADAEPADIRAHRNAMKKRQDASGADG